MDAEKAELGNALVARSVVVIELRHPSQAPPGAIMRSVYAGAAHHASKDHYA
jgi:hypothetical protein